MQQPGPRRRGLGLVLLCAGAVTASDHQRDAGTAPAPLTGIALPAARPPSRVVRPGIEVLLRDSLHLVRGQRVGLITNHTGRDRAGRSTIDLLHAAPGVRLVALFAPEHGLRGRAAGGERIASGVDATTGLPVYSLYGATKVPTPRMLSTIDVLVYDIQDVGARPYTYIWTLALAAQAAARAGKQVVVLDRPDPIRGDRVAGGVLRPRFRSFVGEYPIALRYGLTPGELLRYLVRSGRLHARVTVVPMDGWQRAMWYDETGLPWVNPSPAIGDVETAALYAGMVFFEATNVNEGRGTDRPFHLVGAPWLDDAGAIASELNAARLGGVRFDSTSRVIAAGGKYAGRRIPMISITVTDRDSLRPVTVAVRLMRAIHARHRREWRWQAHGIEELAGTDALRHAVDRDDVDPLLERWDAESARWADEARGAWIYP